MSKQKRSKAESDSDGVLGTSRRVEETGTSDRALQIAEILAEIFKHLDFPRLKKFRRVSKLWNHEISRRFSEKKGNAVHVNLLEPTATGIRSVSAFRGLMGTHNEVCPVYPFREIFLNPMKMSPEDSSWIYCKFNVTQLFLYASGVSCTLEQANHSMAVLTHCSPTLKTLASVCLGEWNESMASTIQFPFLEDLQPIDYSTPESGLPLPPTAEQELKFFSRIIAASPKLKCIQMFNYPHTQLLLQMAPFKCIKKLELRPVSEHADIWESLDNAEWTTLTDLTWRDGDELDPARFSSVLSRFAGSLEKLYITWFVEEMERHPVIFPLCLALTHLEVHTLDTDAVTWNNLPNLRYLKFKRIRSYDLDENFVPCRSVKKISFRGDNMEDPESSVSAPEMEVFFPKFFVRFPKAVEWKVHYKDVRAFCIAAVACENLKVRKFSVYLLERSCYGDPLLAHWTDEFMFSLLPDLKDLEELVFENSMHEDNENMKIRLSKVHFSKMMNLKLLKIYNADPPKDECVALRCIPKVLMVQSSSNWKEPIISMSNVEFRRAAYKARDI